MIDMNCLEHVRARGRKTVAKCPACGEVGADKHGEHLVIDERGAFGCVVNPGPDGAAHRKRIFELVGIREVADTRNARPRQATPRKSQYVASLPPMPPDVAAQWQEGVDHLLATRDLCEKIDAWRSWAAGTARKLAADRLIACPPVYGRRGTAFAVQAPFLDYFDLVSTRDIGFHHRHRPAPGERARWTYHPNEKAEGMSCPALPFVIGGGVVPFAATIIVAEGQFDAITLAAAAGWLVSDASWPERIVVFGTRGVPGWKPLLEAWGSFVRADARFVVFPDADAAGSTWLQPGGFVETLRARGHRVRVVRSCEAGAKDLNDLHRSEALTIETIDEWLALGRAAQ